MNGGMFEDLESPEYEPLAQSGAAKLDLKVKLLKKSGHNITASKKSSAEAEAYEIIRNTSCSEDDVTERRKKGTKKNLELKRLQESFIGSKDLSLDSEFSIYEIEEPRVRRQSKYFEIGEIKLKKRTKSGSKGRTPSRGRSSDNFVRSRSEQGSLSNYGKKQRSKSTSLAPSEKLKRSSRSKSRNQSMTRDDDLVNWSPPPKKGKDPYCWKCKKCENLVPCSRCERSFHLSCVKFNSKADASGEGSLCPECIGLDNFNKQSLKAGKIPFLPEELNNLLSLTINRLQNNDLFKPFKNDTYLKEVNKKFIVKPVTINKLSDNVTNNFYKTTEEFSIEVKWFLHNVLIINNIVGQNNKLLSAAKTLVKSVKHEAIEIECCSECYYAANTKENWFIDVCSKPHLIVWAKLKGFPFWPAKVMGLNIQHMVSVRFFGDHDRAQIPIKDCYLYSKEFPCPGGKKNNRSSLQNCISEVETHIEKLKAKYGIFEYAPSKTPYDPNKEIEQLNQMLPKYKDYMEKQLTRVNTGLQFKIYKTSDNNLSMTQIQNAENTPSSTTTDRPTLEAPKKPNYDSVPTKVVLKRRPSGEYVVENKRGRRQENIRKSTTNSIVAEIMKKNHGVTITKIPTVVEKRKTVDESIATQSHNPFIIKTEPVEHDERPVEITIVEPPVNNERTSEPVTTNISIVKQEDRIRISRPIQQSTPIVVEPPVSNFEMSSNMVSIPIPVSALEPSTPTVTNQQSRTQPRSFSASAGPFSQRLEENANKITDYFRKLLMDTYHDMAKSNDPDALIMTMRLEMERERKELNQIIIQKNLEIKELVQNFEKTKADIRREVESTKRKQWCANCWKEAQFYCCWNTSYCSYDCQTKHWIVHCPSCSNHDRPNTALLMNSQKPSAGSSTIHSPNVSVVTMSTPTGSHRRKFESPKNNKYIPKNGRDISFKRSSPDSSSQHSSPVIRVKSIPNNFQNLNQGNV